MTEDTAEQSFLQCLEVTFPSTPGRAGFLFVVTLRGLVGFRDVGAALLLLRSVRIVGDSRFATLAISLGFGYETQRVGVGTVVERLGRIVRSQISFV